MRKRSLLSERLSYFTDRLCGLELPYTGIKRMLRHTWVCNFKECVICGFKRLCTEFIYGKETSTIAYQGKGQKSTKSGKIDAYSFLGLTRPNTGTLSGEGFNNKQFSLE